MVTRVTPTTVRHPHNLHIALPHAYNSTTSVVSSDDSLLSASSSSAGPASATTSSDGSLMSRSSRAVLFSVLCLHDYESKEESGLSFRKNEILRVVGTENSGWWAARRKGNRMIGWIPMAFVARLEDEWVDRYEKLREEIRCYEYQAEMLYSKAPISKLGMLGSDTESTISRSSSMSSVKPRPVSKPLPPQPIYRIQSRDQVRPISPVVSPIRKAASFQRPRLPQIPQAPPSPSNPMPLPPPQSAPLYNKPVPPLPPEADRRPRAGSENALRGPKMPVKEGSARPGLSTLIEGPNGMHRYASPDIASRRSKRGREPPFSTADSHARERNPKPIKLLDKPRYILPAHADELDVDEEGLVRGGSLVALVERLTSEEAFKERPRSNGHSSFASVFLMTFRTFTTSEKLFDMLLDRFAMTRPDNLLELEVEDWKRRCLQVTQRYVLAVFTLWLEDHRMLEDDGHIAARIPDFVNQVALRRLEAESQALMQVFERLSFAIPVGPQMTLSPRRHRRKPLKDDFLKIEPSDIAEQLTLYEYQRYSKIAPRECLAYVHTQTGSTVFHLEVFCRTYDQLAKWVKTSILLTEQLAARTTTVDHWIKIAEKCRQMNNFSSMSAILSALSSTVVTNLTGTWADVKRKSQLEAMARYNQPTNGWNGYRTLQANIEESQPCVPFITMYLQDVTRIREQYKDELPMRICFIQRQRWYDAISVMLKFQKRPYLLAVEPPLQQFLESHLKEAGSRQEDWFWGRSDLVRQAETQHTNTSNTGVYKALSQAGF